VASHNTKINVADPGSGALLAAGSGEIQDGGKIRNRDPELTFPDHLSESLERVFLNT
jgi:hypothetical protein